MKRNSIRCKCGTRIRLGEFDLSDKRHGHCRKCQLEWHMLPNGRVYSHVYKNFKKKEYTIKVKVKLPEFNQIKEVRVPVNYRPAFKFVDIARVKHE